MTRTERIEYGLLYRQHSNGCVVRVYGDRLAIEAPSEAPLSWELLQRIKHEMLGDIEAVEYYPRNADAVNLRNVRHLWYGSVHYRNHPEFQK